MNILTEDAAEVVVMNFRRLMPTQRRQVLQQLIADLDLPQQKENGIEGRRDETASEAAVGGLLAWLQENAPPAELETFLARRLPDFNPGALTDPQQRLLLDQRLSELSPLDLYQLHRDMAKAGKNLRLTPEEIVEITWGTIRETDQGLLREIIEDEEYCGY
ncbi:MAG: hypothetical protein ACKV2V_24670 [Blastocatellia bacterium]